MCELPKKPKQLKDAYVQFRTDEESPVQVVTIEPGDVTRYNFGMLPISEDIVCIVDYGGTHFVTNEFDPVRQQWYMSIEESRQAAIELMDSVHPDDAKRIVTTKPISTVVYNKDANLWTVRAAVWAVYCAELEGRL